ncbi:hypothetical protein DMUE_2064 [Dictyocoela muelleri]|nr:hypothetical protein DMUE_2064 [Dictyocoela muelleri]
MAEVNGYNFPLVYIFMKNKIKTSYINAFKFLKSKISSEKTYKITIDFEMADLLALNEVFSNSCLYGSFFHFTQLLFRKIQQMGYFSQYRKNSHTREVFRMIIAMHLCLLKNYH